MLLLSEPSSARSIKECSWGRWLLVGPIHPFLFTAFRPLMSANLGLHAIAFAKALRAMRRDMRGRRTKSLRTRSSKLWFLFVGLLWTTALANGICHIMMNSKARIHYDMSPHLSFDYFASHQTSTVNTVSIVSQILCLVLTDVFLVRHAMSEGRSAVEITEHTACSMLPLLDE